MYEGSVSNLANMVKPCPTHHLLEQLGMTNVICFAYRVSTHAW